jgi:hypothetical protein
VNRVVTIFVALSSVTVLVSCKSDGRALKPASPSQSLSIVVPTTIPVTTLAPGEGIPAETLETLPAEISTTALSLNGSWVDG